MYIRKSDATGSVEKRTTLGGRKLDYDSSGGPRYGLTWTPSRDESLSTSSIRNFKKTTVNPTRDERIFETVSMTDREKSSTWATTEPSRVISNDLDALECWLSGEKFFRRLPAGYNDNDDVFTIPTRDKSDGEDGGVEGGDEGGDESGEEGGDGGGDCEGRKQGIRSKWHSIPQITIRKRIFDKDETIDSFDDLKINNDKRKNYECLATIRKPPFVVERPRSFPASSSSRKEDKKMEKILCTASNRSTNENVSVISSVNVIENSVTPARANIHNHIYLPSDGSLDRYFNLPLWKFLRLTRRNVRTRCNVRTSRATRRVSKKSKRSRSRLIGPAYRNGSIKFEVENLNNDNVEERKGQNLPKRDVRDLLVEIEKKFSVNLHTAENLGRRLPEFVLDTTSTSEIRRKLKEVAKRCKDLIRNSKDREEAIARINDLLAKTVDDLNEVVKRKSLALLQEEHYYTRLQLESVQGRQDFVKMKRLKNDIERTSSNWEEYNKKMRQLLNTALTLTNDMSCVEENKENIKKTSVKRNPDSPRNKPTTNKVDVKMSRAKSVGSNVVKKESQMETQMSLLSKTRTTVASTGKSKVFAKDVQDGNRERIKDKTLRQNEERQTSDKARRSVYTVSTNLGSHQKIISENSQVTKDRNKDKKKDVTTSSSINTDVQFNDRSKPPINRRKRQISSTTPLPAWRPGGAVKSFNSNSTTLLHVEPPSRRTLTAPSDKENPESTKSVKRSNPAETPRKTVLKEHKKNDNFREERVTKLCKLLAEVKMQKGSKEVTEALPDMHSSVHSQSEVASLSISNATDHSFLGARPRPPISRSTLNNNNSNDSKSLLRDTQVLFQDKSGVSLPLTKNSFDFPSKLSVNFPLKHETKDKQEDIKVRGEKNSTLDIAKSSMLLIDQSNTKSSNVIKSNSMNDESDKTNNITRTDSRLSEPPQRSCLTVTTLNTSDGTNVNRKPSLERCPSFVSLANVSCNAILSSASNSTTVVASSKCCQVSFTSSSSRTCSNYDRLFSKKQSSVTIPPTIEKDSLESSTDDDPDENEFSSIKSNDRDLPNFDVRGRRSGSEAGLSEYEMSLSDLKDLLRKHVLRTEEMKLNGQGDRKKPIETALLFDDVSKNSTSSEKTSLINIPIDSINKYIFKSDDNESFGSIRSKNSNCSMKTDSKKFDKSMMTLRGTTSKGSQTISDLKDACTNSEDIKLDRSDHVDATVSCYELGLIKIPLKDAATETLIREKTNQTQTNPLSSSTKCVFTDFVTKQDVKNDRDDRWTDTEDLKCDKLSKFHQNQDISLIPNNTNHSECLLNAANSFATERSSLSESSTYQSKDIHEDRSRTETNSAETLKANISNEFGERFPRNLQETSDGGISEDIIDALQTIEQYATNLYEAIQIYVERLSDETPKSSLFSSSSGESVLVSTVSTFTKHEDVVKKDSVIEDFNDLNEDKNQIGSCQNFDQNSEESKAVDYFSDVSESLDEFDDTKSHASSVDKMLIPLKINVQTQFISQALSVKDQRLNIVKYTDGTCGSGYEYQMTKKIMDDDYPEVVPSSEALLLFTYLTVCAFVFWCLQFSMICES